ncbi:hypothetical protein DA2_2730 [Desulfovibrio sp. A2]|nr:hypothetical protein DA2_2730 [Desulfovibrio sp. A2]
MAQPRIDDNLIQPHLIATSIACKINILKKINNYCATRKQYEKN